MGSEMCIRDRRFFRYTNITGISASRCTGMLEVRPRSSGSVVDWRVQYLGAAGVRGKLTPLLKTGLESLKSRFGGAT